MSADFLILAPSEPRPATVLKWTCDEAGTWRQVPVALVKTKTGYLEYPAQIDLSAPRIERTKL